LRWGVKNKRGAMKMTDENVEGSTDGMWIYPELPKGPNKTHKPSTKKHPVSLEGELRSEPPALDGWGVKREQKP
jgi:hypothetical protein